jgi:hypothetical protein
MAFWRTLEFTPWDRESLTAGREAPDSLLDRYMQPFPAPLRTDDRKQVLSFWLPVMENWLKHCGALLYSSTMEDAE